MSNVTYIVPDDAELFAVAQTAVAKHLHLIERNGRFVLSPVIPEGWTVVPVGDKSGEIRRMAA
ncbi:MAG: hypothetical protein JSS57_04460 [Proteobacteria bacterium]|nr:hypothetical protein [Pseudomonadota bacterium]